MELMAWPGAGVGVTYILREGGTGQLKAGAAGRPTRRDGGAVAARAERTASDAPGPPVGRTHSASGAEQVILAIGNLCTTFR